MLYLNNNPISLVNHLSLWNFPWKVAQSDFFFFAQSDFSKPDNRENYLPKSSKEYLSAKCYFFFICLYLIPSCQEEDFWKSYRKTDKRQGEHMFLKYFIISVTWLVISSLAKAMPYILVPGFWVTFHGSYWLQTLATYLKLLLNLRAKAITSYFVCTLAQISKHTVFISNELQRPRVYREFGFRVHTL